MHGVGIGPPTCSSCRIFMDDALGLPAISLDPWNETRYIPFVCSPSSSRDPWYECMWYVWLWVVDIDHFMQCTSHQVDVVSYRSRHTFTFRCYRHRDHGLGMQVGHGYRLISF